MDHTTIMQCKNYNQEKLRLPVAAQVKMNGIFGRYDSNSGKFFTRSDNIIRGLSFLEEGLQGHPSYDGELLIPGLDFYTSSGLIRSHNSVPECMFYVFDQPIYNIKTVHRLWAYTERLTTRPVPKVHPLKFFICATQAKVDEFYSKVIALGHEGVVYKNLDQYYFHNKKWAVQKRVPEHSTECCILSLIEGKNSFTGTLGAFVVDYNGHKVRVGNGKGLTQSLRQAVWNNPTKYIGTIMKVGYKSITPDGSLQTPKFIEFRWDI